MAEDAKAERSAGARQRRRRRQAARQTEDAASAKKVALASRPPRRWVMADGEKLRLRPSSPLVDHQSKLLVYWAPKSACTSVYIWFSAFAGFIEEVKEFNARKPHRHRNEIYNKSQFYQTGLNVPADELFAIKVLRDPYSRAISIYRHALSTGFADSVLETAFGGTVNTEEGFSIHKFFDLVEMLDLSNANPHFMPQTLPRELVRKADHVVNISRQDLFKGLNDAVASRGMTPVDLEQIAWLHDLERHRKAKTLPVEGDRIDEMAFGKAAARGRAPFPNYDQLLTGSVKERVRKIFAIDFDTYGSYL